MDNAQKFDKFTERARKVLSLAQEEAQRFSHNYIGTEHLLLGLVREGDGVAAKVLNNLGADLDKIRSAVEFIIGRGDRLVLGEIGLTPRAKKVIELAVDEARRLNHHYVGTEHILLGLVREGEGIAAGVLESLGVNLVKVRAETIRVLTQAAEPVASSRPSKTPTLDAAGNDLTQAARTGGLDLAVGNDADVARIIQVLSRQSRSNPLLIGKAGFSRSNIIAALAQRIVSGEVPDTLARSRLIALDASALAEAPADGGDAETRVKTLFDEARASGDCILMLGDIHTWFGASMAPLGAALKAALRRGEIQVIGTTTAEDARGSIERDATLSDSFQQVVLHEPSDADTIQMLYALRPRLEAHHRLTISNEAIQAAVEVSRRQRNERPLLDQAIDLLDETASHTRLMRSMAPLNLKEAMRGLEAVLREKAVAIDSGNFDAAAELRDREVKLRDRISKLEAGWQRDQGEFKLTVTAEDIAATKVSLGDAPATRNQSPRRIFISYRRFDSADAAGRIDDQLITVFGREHVFKDTDSIPLGKDFRQFLDGKITGSDVVLVIIGLGWLAANEQGVRRIDDASDYVRYEIERALEQNKPLIPVLVQGAMIPKKADLPESIQDLVFRQGLEIRSDSHFHQDAQYLIDHIQRMLDESAAE